jgi:hypothetical protein
VLFSGNILMLKVPISKIKHLKIGMNYSIKCFSTEKPDSPFDFDIHRLPSGFERGVRVPDPKLFLDSNLSGPSLLSKPYYKGYTVLVQYRHLFWIFFVAYLKLEIPRYILIFKTSVILRRPKT